MHLKKDIKLLAFIMLFIGFLMLVPLAVSIYFHETVAIKSFLITQLCIAIVSALALLFTRKENLKDLLPRDGYFL